jgi:PilZ domain
MTGRSISAPSSGRRAAALCIAIHIPEPPEQLDLVWHEAGTMRRAASHVLEAADDRLWIEVGRPVDAEGRALTRRTASTLTVRVRGEHGSPWHTELRDVPAGGLGLRSQRSATVGQRVPITVVSSSGEPLSVDACVVHVRETEDGWLLGCAFERLLDVSLV